MTQTAFVKQFLTLASSPNEQDFAKLFHLVRKCRVMSNLQACYTHPDMAVEVVRQPPGYKAHAWILLQERKAELFFNWIVTCLRSPAANMNIFQDCRILAAKYLTRKYSLEHLEALMLKKRFVFKTRAPFQDSALMFLNFIQTSQRDLATLQNYSEMKLCEKDPFAP